MTEGQSFQTWWNKTKNVLATGPVGISKARTVYQFNTSQAFHHGQDLILGDPLVGDQFPYVFVYTIPDSRRSEACRTMSYSGLNGTACYRRDDPAYVRNKTPRHQGCRCKDTMLTVRQAAKLVTEAQKWEETGTPPTVPEHVPYFEVKMPGFLADERGANRVA